jgi:hypothetical protein
MQLSKNILTQTPGNSNLGEMLSTADLLNKIACFEKNNVFNIRRSRTQIDSKRWLTVLSPPLLYMTSKDRHLLDTVLKVPDKGFVAMPMGKMSVGQNIFDIKTCTFSTF